MASRVRLVGAGGQSFERPIIVHRSFMRTAARRQDPPNLIAEVPLSTADMQSLQAPRTSFSPTAAAGRARKLI